MKHEGYNEFFQRGRFDFPIEFYHVEANHPRFHMPYHWHMEYEIIWVKQGALHLILNETDIHAKAGDVVFVRDGVIHGGMPCSQDTIYDCVVFDMGKLLSGSHTFKEQIETILSHDILVNKYLPVATSHIPIIVKTMFNALKNESPGYELIVTGMLYAFFGFILEYQLYHFPQDAHTVEHNRKRRNQLKKTFALIDSSYDQPLTLADLADAAGLSPNYFCRFFKKHMGITLLRYLNEVRISHAGRLLMNTDMSISEVMNKIGFTNQTIFNRLFKEIYGLTPRQARNNSAENTTS